jgi:hypothetical protein
MLPMDSREAVPRGQVGRAVGIIGLVGIALIHFLDAISAIDENKFVFGLYIMLMIVTLLAGGILGSSAGHSPPAPLGIPTVGGTLGLPGRGPRAYG